MKKCSKCREIKELTEFYKKRSKKDGHSYACKVCEDIRSKQYKIKNKDRMKIYNKAYRQNNAEELKVKRVEYSKTPIAKQLKRGVSKKYNETYPLKVIAVNRINKLVFSGKIERGGCEVCGEPSAEGHHCDYTKPFDVVWLCKKHHEKWHDKNKAYYP